MSVGFIMVVTLMYVGVATSELWSGHYGLALVFAAYALANVGLIWSMQ